MPIIQQLICKIYAEYEFSAISMVAIEWESIKDINAWRTDIGFKLPSLHITNRLAR
jgi:hypothetical protein